MSLWESVDNYCERIDAGFLSEPVNAFTNIAFFIAAWLLWKNYKAQDKVTGLLIALVSIVGLGSLLFHTFATGLAMLADIIPIMVFVYTYLYLAFRRFLGLSQRNSAFGLAIFTGFAWLATKTPSDYSLNGSIMYVPCLVVLMLLAWAMKNLRRETARYLGLASLCFTISLTFRSIDMTICPSLPLGTHFLWHCLNGLLLYLLVTAYARHPK